MQGQISRAGYRTRFPLTAVALLGSLLLYCASASANTKPVLALHVTLPLGAGFPTLSQIRATQAQGGGEVIALASTTPSVCELIGEVWGPNEEQPPEREVLAEVRYLDAGTCTWVASVKATSTTEASELSESFAIKAVPGAPVTTVAAPTIPELAFDPPTGAYFGSVLNVGAKSSRPGLRLSSLTPAVCTLGPAPELHAFEVPATFLSTGTCTLTASLPKTAEHEALEVTKSILVGTVSFTSTPPSAPVAGGSYAVSATSLAGLAVYLGAEGACSLTKPEPEQHLPEEDHSVEAEGPTEAPASVYFLKAA